MMEEIRIGGVCTAGGWKKRWTYAVRGIDYPLPVTVVNGAREGRRVLITAGIHGCEYVAIQSAIELADELRPDEIAGAVILVHPVNTSGFRAMVPAMVPEAGENLNRLFPGREDGKFAERIAWALTSEFQSIADFYMDLHGGDLGEELEPFVFYPGIAGEEVVRESRRIAETLDLKYMLKSSATTGAYNAAAMRGLPSILIERGGCGLWSREEVALYKNDLRAALFALGILPSPPCAERRCAPREVVRPVYLASDSQGCWYPSVRAGDFLEKGQPLGEVKNFWGENLAAYEAQSDGVVLYRTASLSVNREQELVAYAELS